MLGRRAARGLALVAAVDRHRPDLAIVDVRMPPAYTDEGLRAAIRCRQRHPEISVLVLSQYVEAGATAADRPAVQAHRQGTPGAELMAEGHKNASIAEQLVVTGGAVEKHISNVFAKLGLAEGDSHNRRVLAVLTYLRSET